MRTFEALNKLCGGRESAENWSQHTNGEGWVHKTARVAATVYIGPEAVVFSGAAQISGEALIYGAAQIYGAAHISGAAQIYGAARISGAAHIYGDAWISG